MNEIIDLIATDASAADISDKIKDALYSKATEKIESQHLCTYFEVHISL